MKTFRFSIPMAVTLAIGGVALLSGARLGAEAPLPPMQVPAAVRAPDRPGAAVLSAPAPTARSLAQAIEKAQAILSRYTQQVEQVAKAIDNGAANKTLKSNEVMQQRTHLADYRLAEGRLPSPPQAPSDSSLLSPEFRKTLAGLAEARQTAAREGEALELELLHGFSAELARLFQRAAQGEEVDAFCALVNQWRLMPRFQSVMAGTEREPAWVHLVFEEMTELLRAGGTARDGRNVPRLVDRFNSLSKYSNVKVGDLSLGDLLQGYLASCLEPLQQRGAEWQRKAETAIREKQPLEQIEQAIFEFEAAALPEELLRTRAPGMAGVRLTGIVVKTSALYRETARLQRAMASGGALLAKKVDEVPPATWAPSAEFRRFAEELVRQAWGEPAQRAEAKRAQDERLRQEAEQAVTAQRQARDARQEVALAQQLNAVRTLADLEAVLAEGRSSDLSEQSSTVYLTEKWLVLLARSWELRSTGHLERLGFDKKTEANDRLLQAATALRERVKCETLVQRWGWKELLTPESQRLPLAEALVQLAQREVKATPVGGELSEEQWRRIYWLLDAAEGRYDAQQAIEYYLAGVRLESVGAPLEAARAFAKAARVEVEFAPVQAARERARHLPPPPPERKSRR